VAEPRRATAPPQAYGSATRSRTSSSPISSSTLAVLAGIAAADAACCAALGRRPRGQNHDEAAALVRTITPSGEAMARDLDRLLALKDDAQYGVLIVSSERARSSVGWARRLVAAAREVVTPAG
jgi:hypothetical protein